METPRLGEAKQDIAESLLSFIEIEKAKGTIWEVKYNHIIKSKEAKRFVFAFYTDTHVKTIPGLLAGTEQVSQSSPGGGITTTQEPAIHYSDA